MDGHLSVHFFLRFECSVTYLTMLSIRFDFIQIVQVLRDNDNRKTCVYY